METPLFKKITFFVVTLLLLFPFFSSATEKNIEISFFYRRTCPYCSREKVFLDEIEKKYPEVKVNRYLAEDPRNQELLEKLAREHNAERYIGLVPLTFIGKDFFLGFDDKEGIGKEIDNSIQRQLKGIKDSSGEGITLPFVGRIDQSKYSLPVLAVILGFLDGFNVCSLGALVLILGIVLALRSRAKISVFGVVYILTTTIVYGLLIALWYKIFSILAPYIKVMDAIVGLIAIAGAIYFLRQFLKFKKQGPVCEAEEGGIASKFSTRLQESLKNPGNIIGVIGSILLFAAVITVVEFPCSATVPVVFAAIVAKSNISTLQYLLCIAIYMLFYMIDEIILFLVAAFTMKIWLASKKITTWLTLIEAIILFFLGFYYLKSIINF
ncbi:MAG: hypothetical protein V1841_01465 [Patescibacteria group bacterium]